MSPQYLWMLDALGKTTSAKKRARRQPPLRLELLEARNLMAAFTPGDVVVYRVGDSTTPAGNSAATTVYLDEYNPANGALVQSIELSNSTANGAIALTDSGKAGSAGQLSLGPNGQDIALFGYNANVGTASVTSSTVDRSVGIVGANGIVQYEDFSNSVEAANNARTAVYDPSTGNLYLGGKLGLNYTGSFSSGTIAANAALIGNASVSSLEIFNGQLYYSTSSSIAAYGTGEPTGNATAAPLTFANGTPTAAEAFFLARLGNGASFNGYDTLYLIDQGGNNTSGGTIDKFFYNGTSWVSDGTIAGVDGANATLGGITGVVNGNGTVSLYASAGSVGNANQASQGADLYALIDSTGANGAISGNLTTPGSGVTASNPVHLASGSDENFRGIVLAPGNTVDNFSIGIKTLDNYSLQSGTPITLASGAAFTDPSNYLMGGNLVISDRGSGNASTANDAISIANGGGITTSGSVVFYDGQQIGTFSGGSGGGNLTIAFNSLGNSTNVVASPAVQALLNEIDFSTSGNSAVGNHTLTYTVNELRRANIADGNITVDVASGNPPTISQSGNVAVADSSSPGVQTVNLSGITANGTGQTLSVTATSDNQSLIANGHISVGNTPNANGTDTLNFTPTANASGTANITVDVSDANGTTPDKFEVTVVAPPTINAPGNQSATEGANLTISFGGNAVSDDFFTSGNITLKLADVDGNLTIATGVASGVANSGIANNGTGTVTLTGTPSAIAATLSAGVTYNSGASFVGNDTLTLSADDQGNTALGTPLTSSKTVNIAVSAPVTSNQSFTPGDVVVYRVGDSTTPAGNSAATTVYLDEYNPTTGALVESIELSNSTANGIALTDSGKSGSSGQLSLGPDGQEIALFGYNANIGTASVTSSTVQRTAAIVGANGVVQYEDFSNTAVEAANNARAAVYDFSTGNLYLGGKLGLNYTGDFANGATNANAALIGNASISALEIFNGQLYYSSGGNISSYGTGEPTANATATPLAFAGGAPSAVESFFFARLGNGPAFNGYDTLYLIDQGGNNTSGGSIDKFSYNGTNWSSDGSIAGVDGANATLDGLTGVVNANGAVSLYASAGSIDNTGQAATGADLYALVDSTSANGAISGNLTTPGAGVTAVTLFQSDGGDESFRGIVLVPTAPTTNQSTVLTNVSSPNLAYVKGAGAVTVDPGITVTAPNRAVLTGATVAISNGTFVANQDTLSFTPQFGITGAFNPATGVLTLNGNASAADYQVVLSSVSYTNSSTNPNTITRNVSFTVNTGGLSSNSIIENIEVSNISAPVFTQVGNALTVAGVESADTLSIVFTSPTTFRAQIGSTSNTYNTAKVGHILFIGGASNGAANITGPSGTVFVNASPGSMVMNGSGVQIVLVQTATITVRGNQNDVAVLYGDATFKNTVTANPGDVVMQATGYRNEFINFGVVQGYVANVSDVAYLYGSAGNDSLLAMPGTSILRSAGFADNMAGFQTVYAFAMGGQDTATLYGGAGSNVFASYGSYSRMSGTGYFIEASGFKAVQAYATSGKDTAYFYADGAADTLRGSSNTASMNFANSTVSVAGYPTVDAFGSATGQQMKHIGAIDFVLATSGVWRNV